MKRTVIGILAAFTCGFAAAQEVAHSLTIQGGDVENPLTSPADVAAGERVFRTGCALCHGGDGTGGIGPDLTRGVFRHGSSDSALFRNVLMGIPGTDMAGVYRPDSEIWQVVSYVRSLSAGAEQIEVPGDPARGETLYRSRGACGTCHRVNGEGNRVGPDLSDVGWLRSPSHLEVALVRPSEFVPFAFRQVTLRTRDGDNVVGRLLHEDDVSVRLMDTAENLRAFMKADLESFEKPEASMMPAYGGTFAPDELRDLVAYLYSLKGDQP